MVDHAGPTSGGEPSITDRLDSWKEIAAFLGRGVRTVQRWEREEGLPVHRLEHARRGSVFAYRHELTAWWESRASSLGAAAASEDQEAAPVASRRSSRRPLALLAGLAVGLAVVTTAMLRYGRAADAPAVYRVERLTTGAGVTGWPAMSPDGQFVAYASDGGRDGAPLQVWVQPIGGQPSKLTTCPVSCMDPSFSNDGARVLYAAQERDGQSLYEVPVTGGPSRLLRRAARAGRWSPDGRWLAFISDAPPFGLHVATADGTRVRALAADFVTGGFAVWSPDSRHLLIRAQPDPEREADWWTIDPETGTSHNTQVLRWLRQRGFAGRWHTELAPTWLDATSLVFSDGKNLWRQRLTADGLQPRGAPEQLTRGALMAWFASAGGGKVAFVSSNPDVNLRSVAIDPDSGVTVGPLRRITRGSGVVAYLSVSSDGRTLAYQSSRSGEGDVFVRDLITERERAVADTPAREAYSAVSPGGHTVAYGVVVNSERPVRPIVLVDTQDGTSRQVCEDCRGRPRAWLDERTLIVDRAGAPHTSLTLLDVEDGSEQPLLQRRNASVSNPRVSPDRRWVAFDVQAVGQPPRVFIAPVAGGRPIPEERWVLVAEQARLPFWSARGDRLNYVAGPTGGTVRARRVHPQTGALQGEDFQVFAPTDLQLPVWHPGVAPVALSDALLLVLADLRGDVWLMHPPPE